MRKSNLTKFKKYQLNPDLANKFLFKTISDLPNLNGKDIYLMYIFRQRNPYSFLAIKSLLILSSVTLKRCLTSSKLVVFKFNKNQVHSLVYLNLTFFELVDILNLYYKKPAETNIALTSYIKESKYFIFPGYIKHLRMPSWKKDLNLVYHKNRKVNYWIFFYKTIFFD